MSDAAAARSRLAEERRAFRKKHEVGFYARPKALPDGATNLFEWECGIPGKEKTPWAGGLFKVELRFPTNFPMSPPVARFVPPLFHVNVFPNGQVCLSLLDAEKDWRPTMTISAILLGLQDFLDNPNPLSPANSAAYILYTQRREEYLRKVQEEVDKNPSATRDEGEVVE